MTDTRPEAPTLAVPRAFEQVCTRVREMLASGQLRSGDKLPSERLLAENLNVSRGVVREALRTLELAGLIELRKGGTGGSFIVNGQYRMVTQAFKDMVHMGRVSLSDLTEARQRFMTNAIVLACERATEADFEALEANIARTADCIRRDDGHGRGAAAIEFYHLLAVASRNEVLVVTVDAMEHMLRQFFRPAAQRAPLQLIRSRRRLMGHLRARDAAKATREMVAFLSAVQQYLLVEQGATADPAAPSSEAAVRSAV